MYLKATLPHKSIIKILLLASWYVYVIMIIRNMIKSEFETVEILGIYHSL